MRLQPTNEIFLCLGKRPASFRIAFAHHVTACVAAFATDNSAICRQNISRSIVVFGINGVPGRHSLQFLLYLPNRKAEANRRVGLIPEGFRECPCRQKACIFVTEFV